MSEISTLLFAQYEKAAGLAAKVELRMRLLASRTPELAKYAHDKDLESLEERIHQFFDSHFSPEEKDYLRKTRGLRNKILHSDFKSAASVTRQITGPTDGLEPP